MNQTISNVFTIITRNQVPPELDYLFTRVDKAFQQGTLRNQVASDICYSLGGYSTKEKAVGGRVLNAAGLWKEGLTIDHKNHKPEDNRLENLELVTQSENNIRRRKNVPNTFVTMPQNLPGVRVYAFSIEITLDANRADIMELLIARYNSGAMQYRALRSVSRPTGMYSIPHKVLEFYGVHVPKGMTIDHINGDNGLNLPENLRVVTMAQNNQNKGRNRSASV